MTHRQRGTLKYTIDVRVGKISGSIDFPLRTLPVNGITRLISQHFWENSNKYLDANRGTHPVILMPITNTEVCYQTTYNGNFQPQEFTLRIDTLALPIVDLYKAIYKDLRARFVTFVQTGTCSFTVEATTLYYGAYEACVTMQLAASRLGLNKDVVRYVLCPMIWSTRREDCWLEANEKNPKLK